MNIGMMWGRTDPKQVMGKFITEGVNYYTTKYKVTPNCCHMNPEDYLVLVKEIEEFIGSLKMENPDEVHKDQFNGMDIIQNKLILPGNIWIGVKDEKANNSDGSTEENTSSDRGHLVVEEGASDDPRDPG